MSSPLDAIVKEATAEPPELPRMTTSQVFLTHQRLGGQIEAAAREFQRLPTLAHPDCSDALKNLIKNCEAAIANARRLLEANR
jgi:hypothetical protein